MQSLEKIILILRIRKQEKREALGKWSTDSESWLLNECGGKVGFTSSLGIVMAEIESCKIIDREESTCDWDSIKVLQGEMKCKIYDFNYWKYEAATPIDKTLIKKYTINMFTNYKAKLATEKNPE